MAASALRSLASHVLRTASAIVCKTVNGSHVLRINSYSHLKDVIPNGKSVNSCDPNGDSEIKDHIGVYLQLASDPQDELVTAQPRFSLLNQLGNPALPKKTGKYNFSRGSAWGFQNFISRHELEKSEYLKDDRFAIQCDVSITTVRKCSDHWVFISQNPEHNAA